MFRTIFLSLLIAGLAGFSGQAFAQSAPKGAAAIDTKPAPKASKDRCRDGETSKVADYKISKGPNLEKAINEALTDEPGDPEKGLQWMAHRRLGNCLACHEISAVLERAKKTPNIEATNLAGQTSSQPLGNHGEVGPSLNGIASRYSEGELRILVVDPKAIFPDTIMPAFHKNTGLTRVHPDCQGLSILSAQQVEDVVAFLGTLK